MMRKADARRDGTRVAAPTAYADANWVLAELVRGARCALAGNFVGAYLQGSFALGEADVYSDLDFVVVTDEELTGVEVAALQHLHGRLYGLETRWAQHLEGSYAPRRRLRTVDPMPSPFLFLDNGAEVLEPDAHCNSAVVRWILREHGVRLAGPDAKELVDPVSADDLRREARQALGNYVEWAAEPTPVGPMSRWKQPYLVLTFCRILHTLETGVVASKRVAAAWACDRLASRWSPLIQRAVADRADPWARVHQRAHDAAIRQTSAFTTYALEWGMVADLRFDSAR